MAKAEHTITVHSDLSEVNKDLKILENQVEDISDTLKRLEEKGIEADVKLKLQKSFF